MSAKARSIGSEFFRNRTWQGSSTTLSSSMIRNRRSRAFKPATLTWRNYDSKISFVPLRVLCGQEALTAQGTDNTEKTRDLHGSNHPFSENLRRVHYWLW